MSCCIDPQAVIKGQGSQKQPGANNVTGESSKNPAPMPIESGADRVRQDPDPEHRHALIAS